MSGTGANVAKVPYQLRSASAAGPVWGNTATPTSTGNGVSGTGNGAARAIPVYATVASANFPPDSYTDTVTVTVNY
jgi:spore coat protein U-like protein